MNSPTLGPTWEDAVKDCYLCGFDYFKPSYNFVAIKTKLRKIAEEESESHAIHVAMNDGGIMASITENEGHRKLWWAIEDFYEEHMSEEAYKRFQREAAVAEDLDAAWEAGAFDALLGRDWDLDQVSHLHD